MTEPTQDEGFDEGAGIDDAERVTLQTEDGGRLECVVLAILDHEGASYAVLAETEALSQDEDGTLDADDSELLVTRYDEDADGTARFRPLEDDAVIGRLQEALGDLLDLGA